MKKNNSDIKVQKSDNKNTVIKISNYKVEKRVKELLYLKKSEKITQEKIIKSIIEANEDMVKNTSSCDKELIDIVKTLSENMIHNVQPNQGTKNI